jgi:alcohol dehydrogenase (cytochrome c)
MRRAPDPARVLLVLTAIVSVTLAAQARQGITQGDLLDGLSRTSRWVMYSGDYSGQRHSPLKQITPDNAPRLTAQWTFQTGVPGKFEASPIVIDGVLYVTGPRNHAWAIDGSTGRQIGRYQRALPEDLRLCCGPVNRGFAAQGELLFMATLDAHLIAIERRTAKIVWDIEMADYREGYSATGAPLVVNDLVIVGISGGEYAIRGFLDAYDANTGKREWRFYTVPAAGERASETWPADALQRGGAPTWVTGSYDPALETLYWTTGNPSPDYYGENRKGDNLYSNSLIALDVKTGTLKWHFQFTPHDVHDWDANHVPVLADLPIRGELRKLVMVANRNGFFYVLDRETGAFLQATPFAQQTWAKHIGVDGRPVELPDQRPTPRGTLSCPETHGATNFMSPSYDPLLKLFFVNARDACEVFYSQAPPASYRSGDRAMGGRSSPPPPPHERRGALRAIDPVSGERSWELAFQMPSWGGVLSTAGGVVFTGTEQGEIVAVESRSGRELWRYMLGAPVYAAPITYMIDGRQYLVLGAGATLTAFALPAS